MTMVVWIDVLLPLLCEGRQGEGQLGVGVTRDLQGKMGPGALGTGIGRADLHPSAKQQTRLTYQECRDASGDQELKVIGIVLLQWARPTVQRVLEECVLGAMGGASSVATTLLLWARP
jgi:hypothetical protein